jgi:hypothetical protein
MTNPNYSSDQDGASEFEARMVREIGKLLSDHMTVTASSTKTGGLPPEVVMRIMVVPELRKLGGLVTQLSDAQYDAFLQALALKIVSHDGFRRIQFVTKARLLRPS